MPASLFTPSDLMPSSDDEGAHHSADVALPDAVPLGRTLGKRKIPMPVKKAPPKDLPSDSDDDDESGVLIYPLTETSKRLKPSGGSSTSAVSSTAGTSDTGSSTSGSSGSSSSSTMSAQAPMPPDDELTAEEELVWGSEAWARENRKDVVRIAKWMDAHKQQVFDLEATNNLGFTSSAFPEWRCTPGTRTLKPPEEYGYDHILRAADLRRANDSAFVSYESLNEASQLESDVQLLGCVSNMERYREGTYGGFLSWSNNETRTFTYVREYLEELLQTVPLFGGSYRSTPAQRLGEAIKGACLPIDVKVMMKKCNHTANQSGKTICLGLGRDENVMLHFQKDPTGAGKTSSAIIQAMTGIVTDTAWGKASAWFAEHGARGTRMEHLGLREMPPTIADYDAGLARVAIALVPENLMDQWETTAREVSEAFEREFGKGFFVWAGSNCITRKTTKRDGVKRVLSVAHQWTKNSEKALFWILKADTHSSKVALREAPNLSVWYRIYDEMTGTAGTEPRNSWEAQSVCLHNVVVNATVKQLERQTNYQPSHPLRLALQGHNLSLKSPKHAAIVTLCSSPAWLRRMVGDSMAPLMPAGIQRIAFNVRVQSLAGLAKASDLLLTTPESLIQKLLDNGGSHGLGGPERRELVQRCVGMLSYDEGGDSVHAKLTHALEATKKDLTEIPPDTRAEPGQSLSGEEWQLNSDLQRTRLAHKTMIRLFERLLEAVCSDPRPQCPVTLDDIPIERTCILTCCGVVVDSIIVPQLTNQRCPACRKSLKEGVLRVTQAVEVIQKAQPPPEPKPDAAEKPRATVVPVGDVDALIEAYKAKAGLSCKSSIEAVTMALQFALQWKPAGLRVLLCFNISDYCDDDFTRTREIRRVLMETVHGLTSVDAVRRRSTDLADYKADDETNRVLLINTGHGSSSVAGLDLGNTHLVLFDNMAQRGSVSAASVVQAIGRAMRPQKSSLEQAERNVLHYETHGKSAHPPKMVLTINRYMPPAQTAPMEVDEPAPEEVVNVPYLSDDDDDDDEF